MELGDLEQGLKATATAGHVVNLQELTSLQAGLSLLKSKERYASIFFWGKILGVKGDYYIAYGLTDSEVEFPGKSFYFSGEDVDFKPLPHLSEEAAQRILALGLDTPFTGAPGSPLEAAAEGAARLVEAHRLAQVVQEIDFDTAAVPKGAYTLSEAHTVSPSSAFSGLAAAEATSLDKYVHFRPPASVAALRALARTDAEFYGAFLDPLDGDLPKGSWAIRQDGITSLVTLRSLLWQGYCAYHAPGTAKFGGLYFGYGQKSRDLPFLL